MSEVVRGSAEQSAAAKGVADELRGASSQVGRLRRLQAEQAQAVSGLVATAVGAAPQADGAAGVT